MKNYRPDRTSASRRDLLIGSASAVIAAAASTAMLERP